MSDLTLPELLTILEDPAGALRRVPPVLPGEPSLERLRNLRAMCDAIGLNFSFIDPIGARIEGARSRGVREDALPVFEQHLRQLHVGIVDALQRGAQDPLRPVLLCSRIPFERYGWTARSYDVLGNKHRVIFVPVDALPDDCQIPPEAAPMLNGERVAVLGWSHFDLLHGLHVPKPFYDLQDAVRLFSMPLRREQDAEEWQRRAREEADADNRRRMWLSSPQGRMEQMERELAQLRQSKQHP